MSYNPYEKIDPIAASVLQTAHRDVRLRVEAALRCDPQSTDWEIARKLEVKRAVIAQARAALEAHGHIPARPSSLRIIR
jgi:hypothetical protein